MRIKMNEIKACLERASCILITSHVHPDGDAIGSCLALSHVLKSMGKEAQVVIDDHVPENFDILPGFEDIRRNTEDRTKVDLVVLLDAMIGREGRACSGISAPILNIDHHATNDGGADFVYMETEAAATAEVLYKMFQTWGIAFDKDIATCLYMGIATDTGFFAFPNTRPETLEICANLLRAGARAADIAAAVQKKSFYEVKEIARGLGTLESFADDKAVGIFLDESFMGLELTDELIDKIRYIKDIEVAVLLKAEAENSCRVRIRSERLDAAKLAKVLGGGGHRDAAGATIRESFDKAGEILKMEVNSYLGSNVKEIKSV